MLGILLQGLTISDSSNVMNEAIPDAAQSLSLWDLILAGGWVMIPLFLMSFAAIYLFVERYLTIRAASKTSNSLLEEVKTKVLNGDVEGAKRACEHDQTPIARMIRKGISRIGNPLKDIEAAIENTGKIEVNRLEKNLSTLATIAGAAPTIGFLGTVLGMIQAFIEMDRAKTADVSQMAGGIYEAMITTAGGLIVGLLAYIAYNYLSSILQKVIHRMEQTSIDFIDLLQEPQK